MDEHDYSGPATVFTRDREAGAEVVLRGHFQPIDGRFHWYGRIRPTDELIDIAGGRRTEVVLRTPHGDAAGTLSDPDPWGRYRITGIGAPPFPVGEQEPART